MKAIPLLIVAFVVGGFQVSRTAPPGRGSPSPATKPSVDPDRCNPCVVEVEFREDAGQCVAAKPKKTDKVGHVAPGDVVHWRATNRCSVPVTFGVGNFRTHPRATCTSPLEHDVHEKEKKPENPLEASCAHKLTKVAAGGGSAPFDCPVLKSFAHPRTYAYDIVGGGKVLADPEMEIVP